MSIWKRLFGSATSSRNSMSLEDLREPAEQIVMDRCADCAGWAVERGLSAEDEEAVERFLEASIGSVDVFIERFGLSLEDAVTLFCMTTPGRSHSRDNVLHVLKRIGSR